MNDTMIHQAQNYFRSEMITLFGNALSLGMVRSAAENTIKQILEGDDAITASELRALGFDVQRHIPDRAVASKRALTFHPMVEERGNDTDMRVACSAPFQWRDMCLAS